MSIDAKKGLLDIKTSTTNAYEHLKKVVTNLALSQEGIQSFQKHSYALRGPPKDQIVFKIRESYGHLKDYQSANRTLLGKLNTGTAEEPQQPASLTFIPDLMEQSQMFSKLGVGFGQDQTYRIFKSLCILSTKKNTKQLKFWGKIIGYDKDYYIAEGLADGGDEVGQLSPETQPKGVGVNKWSYWASTNLTGDWTELPIITPTQIKTARKIKYLFTGDLKKNILTNPIFNGTQAHLLKCQIVRINSSCSIIPKGIYSTNADDPKQIQFAENYSFPEVSQMSNKQNWVYFSPSVLSNGRISHLKPENMEEQQAEKELKKMMEKDPLEPRLKVVALNGENWIVRTENLEDTYRIAGKNPKVISKGVVGLKSLIWPGWTTIGWQGKFSSIYVGYGHKAKFIYFPRQPESIMQQTPDREQMVYDK